jgi:hypothetical protein
MYVAFFIFDVGKMPHGAKLLFGLGCLAIVGSVVWSLVAPPRSVPNKDQNRTGAGIASEQTGPIKWAWGYIFAARSVGDGIEISGFQATGENTSGEFIAKLGGFVRSEITGQQFPILVSDRDKLVPTDGYGIPAKHQFHIGARFVETGGMTPTQFLRDFGRLTFQFEYDGQIYKRHFTFEEIEAQVRRIEADLRPKVSPSGAGVRRIPPETAPPPTTIPSEQAPPEKRSEIKTDASFEYAALRGQAHYTPQEIDNILNSLCEIEEIIRTQGVPAARAAKKLVDEWGLIFSEGAAEYCRKLEEAKSSNFAFQERMSSIFQKIQRYSLKLFPDNPPFHYYDALNKFIKAAKTLPEKFKDSDFNQLALPRDQVLQAAADRDVWINHIQGRVASEMQRFRNIPQGRSHG